MGTVVTVCMFIGLLYALLRMSAKLSAHLPTFIHWIIGGIVFMAGAWNILWYASRHITQFWGLAALVSGVALTVTGYFIIQAEEDSALLKKLMPIVLLVLFASMMLYGITIYRL